MSQFYVNTTELKNAGSGFTTVSNNLRHCSREVLSVSDSIRYVLPNGDQVGTALKRLSERIGTQAASCRTLGQNAQVVANLYTRTDNKVAGKGHGSGLPGFDNFPGIGGIIKDLPRTTTPHPGGKKNEGSWISGFVTSGAGLIGGSAGFGVGNWKTDTKAGITAKYKNGKLDEASIGASTSLEVSAVKGEAEGHIGIAQAKVKGEIGKASVKGEVGASLYKDGKLSPALQAKVEAKGAVAAGEVSGKIGNDDFNVNAKADGSVLVGKASAEAGAGVITWKDESGTVKKGVGVSAKAGAEAYVAEGTVSGGVTIFGIKVKASATGKAGGAGASAGGRVTTGGVSGEVNLGLGLGAGIKIDIDWSGFKPKWPWQK